MAWRLLIAAAILATGLVAGDAPTRNVLLFSADEPGLPAVAQFTNAFRTALKDPDPGAVAIYTEYLDLARIGEAVYAKAATRWYREKYAGIRLDAIIAGSKPSLSFLLAHRSELWPLVPIVFTSVSYQEIDVKSLPPGVTGIVSRAELEENVALALQLLPDTRRVAVVAGSSNRDREELESLSAVRQKFGERLQWVDLHGLATEELRRRLASLPRQTIVLWTTYHSDPKGRTYVPREALALMAPSSSAPIFGAYGTYLGVGIVGGRLTDFAMLGRQTAGMVSQVLREGSTAHAPLITSAAGVLRFDWRQLREWGIPQSALPPGSEVEYRVPTFWEDHWLGIAATGGFVVLQSLWIAFLLAERRRRSASEEALRRLSGRLITAQEEERRRIARELHDDVNQRLALLSIELDQLRDDERSAPIRPRLQQLAAKTLSLSSEVHTLAREIHPSKLEHLGLLSAVREYCREVELRHEIAVDLRADGMPERVPLDAALCLYRVLQESLRNAVKHSGAKQVTVSLEAVDHHVRMKVTDKGLGFFPQDLRKSAGLGLVGMRERVGLLGGKLSVLSAPGAGTEISVSVPIPEAQNHLSA